MAYRRPSASCTIEDDRGRVQTLDRLGSGTEVESDGLNGVGTFDVDAGVEYQVTCSGPTSVGEFVVIKFDLSDFYPTVSFRRVKGLFRKAGYGEQVASLYGGMDLARWY